MTKWYNRPLPRWVQYTIMALTLVLIVASIAMRNPTTPVEWFRAVLPIGAGALGSYIASERRAAKKRSEGDQ